MRRANPRRAARWMRGGMSASQAREERRYIRDVMRELPEDQRTASRARAVLEDHAIVEVYVG